MSARPLSRPQACLRLSRRLGSGFPPFCRSVRRAAAAAAAAASSACRGAADAVAALATRRGWPTRATDGETRKAFSAAGAAPISRPGRASLGATARDYFSPTRRRPRRTQRARKRRAARIFARRRRRDARRLGRRRCGGPPRLFLGTGGRAGGGGGERARFRNGRESGPTDREFAKSGRPYSAHGSSVGSGEGCKRVRSENSVSVV